MNARPDPFNARTTIQSAKGEFTYYRLDAIADHLKLDLARLPFTVKVMLENVLRNAGTEAFTEDDVRTLAKWEPGQPDSAEFPFLPARVVLQDFTGVPAVVDLAAMRAAMDRLGADPSKINPLVPTDLVIDHSVQVDFSGTAGAFLQNVEREYERNGERYQLLRWAQGAFENFSVVPPGTGIVHQVNLEYLANVAFIDDDNVVYPDTLVGTDSHTTMINALGVLGWGVGGIEAEAVLLGQPIYMLTPQVVGFRVTGQPPEGVTATDLVLTVAQILRKHGVVGRFVEFFGDSVKHLTLTDRATISNMSPEFGATATMFPIDEETLAYLRLTGRQDDQIDLVEKYARAQGMFRVDGQPDPAFDQIIELDLSTLVPSMSGPRRPHDRVSLSEVATSLREGFPESFPSAGAGDALPSGDAAAQASATGTAVAEKPGGVEVELEDGQKVTLDHGSVVIAAITSCTNTSNPEVMMAAGLLAKKAVEKGLEASPIAKTSLAPGSGVVTAYLDAAGLTPYLEALRFHLVGYGCTTCIGNSGPLAEPIAEAIQENDLVCAAVLSGNRNFEGRIHPHARASYLASPPLVVAYALAGTIDIDLNTDPLGHNANGEPVYLSDVWPSSEEIRSTIEAAINPTMFRERYDDVFQGDEQWRQLPVPEGQLYEWDVESTYVREPSFFQDLDPEPAPMQDVTGARVLVHVGDSVTTDHISPAGTVAVNSPAGRYLINMDVKPRDFNSYGSRRGNHEVMVRGTFANIRLRNMLAEGKEGNWTKYLPTGELMSVYEASHLYQEEGTPLIILAGKEYGSGSSRDWAAKGTLLLGVKAVIAESYERIHRSNLIGMGVLPLQFADGATPESLGLDGTETYDIPGIADDLVPGKRLNVTATRADGSTVEFPAVTRIDSPMEVEYYRHGGILQMVLRRLAQSA
ncbi:MAG: aconitate hydratase AcnA [Sphaerobacteraceae bacterium]|nr:MAG: aconitate hydratase AcnA [Sphaerobacteraceae bacterium]